VTKTSPVNVGLATVAGVSTLAALGLGRRVKRIRYETLASKAQENAEAEKLKRDNASLREQINVHKAELSDAREQYDTVVDIDIPQMKASLKRKHDDELQRVTTHAQKQIEELTQQITQAHADGMQIGLAQAEHAFRPGDGRYR
jgi:DNA anti-recombination protein RmuC